MLIVLICRINNENGATFPATVIIPTNPPSPPPKSPQKQNSQSCSPPNNLGCSPPNNLSSSPPNNSCSSPQQQPQHTAISPPSSPDGDDSILLGDPLFPPPPPVPQIDRPSALRLAKRLFNLEGKIQGSKGIRQWPIN